MIDATDAKSDFTGPVLIMFSAAWCIPCRQLKPKIMQLEQEHQRAQAPVRFLYADVEKCPKLAARFVVQSVPIVFLLRDGNVMHAEYGLKAETLDRLREGLTKLLQ